MNIEQNISNVIDSLLFIPPVVNFSGFCKWKSTYYCGFFKSLDFYKTIIPFLFFVIACQYPVNGQDYRTIKQEVYLIDNMEVSTPKNVHDHMDFEYVPAKGFSLNDDFVSWGEPYTSHVPSSIIHAEDSNFFCLIDIFHTLKKFKGLGPRFTREGRNIYYFNHIRDNLIDAGKYDKNKREDFTRRDLKRNVKFLSKREAREKFNADMAITYKLPVMEALNSLVGQKGKEYTHCDVLMIHKNDLGPVFLYCFYTDEGYKHRKQYYNKLEKAIGFKQ